MGLTLKFWHPPCWQRHLMTGMGNPFVVRPHPGVLSRGASARQTEGDRGRLEGQQS